MDNPYAPPSKRKTDKPPNSFQKELQNKMRERRQLGLSADLTESESGKGSGDELGSDDDLLSGFNMTSKAEKRWTPPGTKKPLAEQNGRKSPKDASSRKPTKAEILFGKKGHEMDEESDEESDDENYPAADMMKTMRKPWQPASTMRSPKYSRDEDEVDADVANLSRYGKKKEWSPPTSAKFDTDDKPKARQRPKSPKPGSLDLDSIKEEKEPENNPFSRPKPQPRGKKDDKSPARGSTGSADAKPRSRGGTPTTDIFGSSTRKGARSPSPKDSYKKGGFDKKGKEKEEDTRRKSLLDMLEEEDRRGKDSKKKGGKKKHLDGSDSDDSIGAELGRGDLRNDPRKNPFSKSSRSPSGGRGGSPLDKSRGSPFDKSRGSPFDKSRGSPFDKSRTSPFDKSRGSPYDDRNRSPGPTDWERKKLGRGPHDREEKRLRENEKGERLYPFADSVYEKRSKDDRASPFDRDSDRYGRSGSFDRNRKAGDKYSDKDRKGSLDKGRRSPFEKDRKYSKDDPFDSQYADRKHQGKDRDRKSPFEKDREARRSPFEKSKYGSREDPRGRSPFEKSTYGSRSDSPGDDARRHYGRPNERDDSQGRYDRDDRGRYDRDGSKGRYDRDDRGRYDRDDSRGRYDRDDKGRYGRDDSRGRYDHDDSRGRYDRDDSRGRYDRDDSRGRYERDDSRGRYDRDDRKDRFDRDENPFSRSKSPFSKDKSAGKDDVDNRHRERNRDGYGRKSPFEREDDRRSPFDRHGPPKLNKNRGRHDHDDDERDDSYNRYDRPPSLRYREDRDKKPAKSTRFDDEEDRYDYDRHRRDPDFEGRGRQRSREKRGEERESSLCRDVEKDESKMRKPDTEEVAKIKKEKAYRSYTKKNQLLDQVIDSVKEEQTKFTPIDPDKKEDKEGEKKPRSQSARRPKPRYAKPMVESFPTSRPATVEFDNTVDIRDTVYMEWYKVRTERTKKEKEEKRKKEKEEEEKKEKAKRDKLEEAKASYDAWAQKKKENDHEYWEKKRREEEKKMKEEEEKLEKKKQAEKNYRFWKENKDVVVKEKEQQKKKEERKKREEEQELKHQKQKKSQSAKKEWERKKQKQVEEEAQERRREKAQKEREERRVKAQREAEARKKYDEWMHKKEQDQKTMRKSMKERRLQETDDPRPAWSPASRTIPVGR